MVVSLTTGTTITNNNVGAPGKTITNNNNAGPGDSITNTNDLSGSHVSSITNNNDAITGEKETILTLEKALSCDPLVAKILASYKNKTSVAHKKNETKVPDCPFGKVVNNNQGNKETVCLRKSYSWKSFGIFNILHVLLQLRVLHRLLTITIKPDERANCICWIFPSAARLKLIYHFMRNFM